MLTYEEAIDQLLNSIAEPASENRKLHSATGYFGAEDIHATLDHPPLPQSAMDGFAVSTPLSSDALSYDIVSKSFAGSDQPVNLTEGQACQVATGAPIPEGSYAVVPIEDCSVDGSRVRISNLPKAGTWVRPQGMDVKCNDLLLEKGLRVTPGVIMNLAQQGLSELKVYERPSVAVVTSGDELVSTQGPRLPHQIYNSNEALLTSLLKTEPARLGETKQLSDNYQASVSALESLSRDHQLIMTVGGASVGERDFFIDALKEIGSLKFWKVKVRPGKPIFVGHINDRVILGLPGNPVSAFVGFHLFARPLLSRLAGAKRNPLRYQWVKWPEGVRPNRHRRDFLRAQWVPTNSSEQPPYRLAPGQTSGHGSDLLLTDLLLEIPSLEEHQSRQPDHIRAFFCT